MTVPTQIATPGTFVAHSEIRVPAAGVDDLVTAFRERLGEVDAWPGFCHLEVWQAGPDAPKPALFKRFQVVAR